MHSVCPWFTNSGQLGHGHLIEASNPHYALIDTVKANPLDILVSSSDEFYKAGLCKAPMSETLQESLSKACSRSYGHLLNCASGFVHYPKIASAQLPRNQFMGIDAIISTFHEAEYVPPHEVLIYTL